MFEPKELRIPAKPTKGPQPWPEYLKAWRPKFDSMTTIEYGFEYGAKGKGGFIENTKQLRILSVNLRESIYTLSIEDDYCPFAMAGTDLIYILNFDKWTYEVKTGSNSHFDEEEYLERDEEDRLVAVIPFEHILDFDIFGGPLLEPRPL